MARPEKELPVATALVPALLRFLRAHGADASLVAAGLGLPEDAETLDETSLAPSRLNELLERAADALGEPYIALRLPAELPFRTYAPTELVVHASATLGDALLRIARYAHFVHPQLQSSFAVDGAWAHFRQGVSAPPRRSVRHAHEYGLAHALTHATRAAGTSLTLHRVWFASPRGSDVAPLHRFFGTRAIDFGCEDSGFTLDASVLATKVTSSDPRLLTTFEGVVEAALRAQPRQRPCEALVTARIEALLPNDASIDAVARALHMSPRTLQRRLDDEGTGFSEVQDAVRERLARKLIVDKSMGLLDVAYRLGFADLASFSRAFKRWTGKPPGAFRTG